ncbi:hypothetical protein ACPXAM_24040, partial [Escherichia coli]|uniref:hypothetical protein n=1 Tax=Escherichia coli TaxID=562 RepID=UPI003CE54226
ANPELARSAGWLLVNNAPPLAKRVMDSEKPGALFLALTAAGKSAASKIYIQQQPPTFRQKLQAVPRSDWIALAAFVVSVIALF